MDKVYGYYLEKTEDSSIFKDMLGHVPLYKRMAQTSMKSFWHKFKDNIDARGNVELWNVYNDNKDLLGVLGGYKEPDKSQELFRISKQKWC